MRTNILLLVLLMAVASHGNIWDNIYSQTLADTPIILSQSLSFDFKLRDNLNAKLDFNADLETVTVFIYIDMLIKIQIMEAQLDLTTLVVTIKRLNSKACERYNIAGLKGVSLDQRKISKERLFLVNVLFKFIGKTKPVNRIVYNIYKLEPYLLSAPTNAVKKIQEQIKQNLPEDEEELDFTPDVQLYLHVNSDTGSLEAIYSGEKQDTKVPFRTVSSVQKKFECQAQIHSMSTDDLKDIMNFIQKNQNQD